VPKEKARPGETVVARNRRASHDYDLGDRFEAGIVLRGSEVKMLRHARCGFARQRGCLTCVRAPLQREGGLLEVVVTQRDLARP
jgi:hypothetical protein